MNKQQLKLDAQTLEIASFSDVPKETISISGSTNKKVRQLQAKLSAPQVSSQAPLTIVRRNLGNGSLQYRVQFIAPTQAEDPDYQTTSVLLQTPGGTVRLQAAAAAGPVIFNAPASSAPTSVVLQQNNVHGSSDVGTGTGNSRALVAEPFVQS